MHHSIYSKTAFVWVFMTKYTDSLGLSTLFIYHCTFTKAISFLSAKALTEISRAGTPQSDFTQGNTRVESQ